MRWTNYLLRLHHYAGKYIKLDIVELGRKLKIKNKKQIIHNFTDY